MPDNISFDFSEINALAASIEEAPREARYNIRKAVTVTSRNIKDAWKAKLQGSDSLPGLPSAVSYDVLSDNSSTAPITAEIGFDKDRRQGPLGNISEFGSPKVAPRGYGLASLNENQEDFEFGIAKAVDDAMRAAGL
ncbi:hypothetical protein B7R22_05355 [Subtercola boreus]|uniref:HK97 gp10 family phage protein n=1 Tax=Subtercola boreus TaxID=120213 RepID=A0A3E0W1Z4_9MICO|nr:hypothetical protein [Subtercola boreus]RFA15835.1 hypothetical protein B7R22_05355 [Subtercola boreus]